MIYPSTDEIYNLFLEKKIMCQIIEKDGSSTVSVSVSGDQIDYDVLFITDAESNSLALRIFRLISFPPDRSDAMIEAAEQCNKKFRFLKFIVDTDSHFVQVQYDFLTRCEDIAEQAFELFYRTLEILRESCPVLLTAAWS